MGSIFARFLDILLLGTMRYLLRQISRRRHDQASELCANPFALRVARCLAAVVRRALFGTTVRHRDTHRALAPLQLVQLPHTIMPAPTSSITHDHSTSHVVATSVRTWVQTILIQVGSGLLKQAQVVLVDWTTRTYAMRPNLANDFWAVLVRWDVPGMKHVAGRFVLLVGKDVILHLAGNLIERARQGIARRAQGG